MSWEITVGWKWPKELVDGEHPSRGQAAVDDNIHTSGLLRDGWEPFAVVPVPGHEAIQIWFKREEQS